MFVSPGPYCVACQRRVGEVPPWRTPNGEEEVVNSLRMTARFSLCHPESADHQVEVYRAPCGHLCAECIYGFLGWTWHDIVNARGPWVPDPAEHPSPAEEPDPAEDPPSPKRRRYLQTEQDGSDTSHGFVPVTLYMLQLRATWWAEAFPSPQEVVTNLDKWSHSGYSYQSVDYIDHDALGQLLSSKAVVLVKGSYFEEMDARGVRLQRRQDVDAKYLWTAREALEIWARYGAMFLLVVSHPWLTGPHPDPHRYHLTRLSKIVASWKRYWGIPWAGMKDVAVFFDYTSLYQVKRSGSEHKCWKRAIDRMEILFGHADTTVFHLTSVPDPGRIKCPVSARGWMLFEQCVAGFKASAISQVYEFGQDFDPSTDVAWEELVYERVPPVIPEVCWDPGGLVVDSFAQELSSRTFQCSTSTESVSRWYQAFFTAKAQCRVLHFDMLRWSMPQFRQFLTVLLHCVHLEELSLTDNVWFEDEHAVQLATVLLRLSCFWKLNLRGCPITEAATSHLRAELHWVQLELQ